MSKKILIVDDEQDMVFMIQSVLTKNGYEVKTASDGEQALKIVKTYLPDLMIVDLTMPNMNGWRFSLKVRENERYKTTPIIVLSGLLKDETPPEQFESGSVYVPKPFDIFKLMDKVKELLKG